VPPAPAFRAFARFTSTFDATLFTRLGTKLYDIDPRCAYIGKSEFKGTSTLTRFSPKGGCESST
jgi:hypothetical protein